MRAPITDIAITHAATPCVGAGCTPEVVLVEAWNEIETCLVYTYTSNQLSTELTFLWLSFLSPYFSK